MLTALTVLTVLAGLVGLVIGTVIFVLSSVLFKDTLKHDPDNPNKLSWFVEVEGNRSVVINRGGRPTHVLRGDEPPVPSTALSGLWMWYKKYVMDVTGYHVYVPYFFSPTVYDLPRYRVREKDGKKVYEVVEKDTPGYRSNHVRTEATTWYFEFSGAEIEKVPYTVKGSVQIRIIRGKEIPALYNTDSWNVLLDQALNSVIRGVVRRDLTLDMVIGQTSDTVWGKRKDSEDPYRKAAELIQQHLEEFATDEGVKLVDLGIDILRVDIIDFEDELTPEERKQLRTATFAKEAARATELSGKAEAVKAKKLADAEAYRVKKVGDAEATAIKARGEATAEAQKKLVDVHTANPEVAGAIINADALRAFAQNGGTLLDGVAAAFIKKEPKK